MVQCVLCRRLFHLDCLKNGKPSTLVGDVFFDLTCASCSTDGSEICTRQHLSWLQAVYLTLYNLYSTSRGRKGYFRWREDICHFIDKHWQLLFPNKKKKNTWNSTVAGILSSGCPEYFKSGQKEFNKETGWWGLQENIAPSVKLTGTGSGSSRKRRGRAGVATGFGAKNRESQLTTEKSPRIPVQPLCADENVIELSVSEHKSPCDDLMAQLLSEEDMRELAEPTPEMDAFTSLFTAGYEDMDDTSSLFTGEEEKSELDFLDERTDRQEDTESLSSTATSEKSCKHPQSDSVQSEAKGKPVANNLTSLPQTIDSLVPVSEEREKELLLKINSYPKAVYHDPVARRFRRKLILRQIKRSKGLKLFDLDKTVSDAVTSTLRYQLTSDGFFPIENRDIVPSVTEDNSQRKLYKQRILKKSNSSSFGTTENVLDRFLAAPRMLPGSRPRTCSFLTRLIGGDSQTLYRPITSPYTSRILKPFIRRDYESRPLKLKLLQEIIAYSHRNDPGWKPTQVSPIDYCYVQPHHIPSVNAMCREFFWPGIDLSECLQYPDFSCVVLYKKFVIGFAFMVPDVNYNEAYISFVLVHPEWRRGGIGTYMIYHLIQTCMGKDVTLHVSVTNPAMLMYQKFGFKPEELIQEFYSRYLPQDSPQCRHAFFLRLRR
nr:cysteine-rich protein 2-binding protein-like [Pocillopora verrucosa]